jgi:hypothetical protein
MKLLGTKQSLSDQRGKKSKQKEKTYDFNPYGRICTPHEQLHSMIDGLIAGTVMGHDEGHIDRLIGNVGHEVPF